MSVMTDIKNRGEVEDILTTSTDNLNCCTDAIKAVFPSLSFLIFALLIDDLLRQFCDN